MQPLAVLALLICNIIGLTYTRELFLDGHGYLRYDMRQEPYNPRANKIFLKFRTTHPTGVLAIMMGVNGDSLRVQLVQGQLRYSLSSKGVELTQSLLGDNLDSNTWHSLKLLRVQRLTQIILDSKYEKTVLLPGVSTELRLNEAIYIGGVGKHFRNKQDQRDELLNFYGCLQNVEVDNRRPFDQLERQDGKVVVNGRHFYKCKDQQFSPFEFTNLKSNVDLLNIPSNPSKDLVVRITFRTFDSEGTLLFAEGRKCHVHLGLQNGMVHMELSQDEVLRAKVEDPTETANGLWHHVLITITQSAIFLKVNDGTKLSASLARSSLGYDCSTPRRLRVGGGADRILKRGFVGCFNLLRVNDFVINVKNRSMARSEDVRLDGCNLDDKCFPNPCRNNGRCTQNWQSYGCDCSKTTFYGKHCDIPIYKETCASYAKIGLTHPSYCILDSDGTGDLEPYTTLCNFTGHREAMTVVHHDRERRIRVSEGNEIFQNYAFHIMNYELGMEKIEALIKKSKFCRQFILFDCYNAILLNAPSGPPNGVWKSRDGKVKTYWGGVMEKNEGCQCGLTQSCVDRSKLCNCDSMNNRWANDSGYLTDKNTLPVTRLQFTNINEGFAYVELGPLECFGNEETSKETESPPPNILNKVCISVTTKEYVTANETFVNWVSPVRSPPTGVPRRRFPSKETDDLDPHDGPSYNHRTETGIDPRSTMLSFTEFGTGSPRETSLSNNANRTGPQQPRSLSILEILLIAFAALAVMVLVTKFIILRGVSFMRRQYQIKRLCDNHDKHYTTESERSLRSDQSEVTLAKKGPRRGLSAYWV